MLTCCLLRATPTRWCGNVACLEKFDKRQRMKQNKIPLVQRIRIFGIGLELTADSISILFINTTSLIRNSR